MIKYLLKCKNKHEFESWFSDSREFEKLKKRELIECIICRSKNINKSIMSPNIVGKKKSVEKNFNQKEFNKVKKDLLKIRKFVEKNFEFVGDNFAKKVREVYYDQSRKKNIYGTTTNKERDELLDEGIDLVSVPWVEEEN